MTGATGPDTTVLVVDDEPELRQMFEWMLGDDYEVITAPDGQTALEEMAESVDAVLLDRRMPGLNGEETLDELRDRGHDTPVAMVTAVEPDAGIVDMAVDDYVVKPIDKAELNRVIEVLVNRAHFDDKSREFYRLAAKKATLEAQKNFEHEASDEYQELLDRMETLRGEIDETLDDMFTDDPNAAFRSL